MKRERKRPYHTRDLVLNELGYGSYTDYLASMVWKEIRRRVLLANSRTCKLCGRYATNVHHLSYALEVLLGQDDTQLVPLCRWCHEKIEFHPDGRKRSFTKVQKAYQDALPAPKELVLGRCDLCGGPAKKAKTRCRACMRKRKKRKTPGRSMPWVGFYHKARQARERLAERKKR